MLAFHTSLNRPHSATDVRLVSELQRQIDRFFETTVTKYEHGKMEERATRLEHKVDGLRQQLVA